MKHFPWSQMDWVMYERTTTLVSGFTKLKSREDSPVPRFTGPLSYKDRVILIRRESKIP